MTDLVPVFERLGLQNYIETFVAEGFDSWETVLHITESDLEFLNVKLGHRRKLQKEIANARGISIEQVIAAGARGASADDPHHPDPSDTKSTTAQGEGKGPASAPSKRKYRRHPKPDENAPERPPSAYVIFSNKVRDELRPHKLSFTEIAKTVGERWQDLKPEEKEQYESQAAAAKEVYNSELAKYKGTSQYRDYMRYLADFKARNAPNTTDGKRLKLETEASNASTSSGTSLNLTRETSNPEHHRKDSLSQSGYSPTSSSINSPTAPISRYVSNSIESPSQSSHPPTPVSAHPNQASIQNVQIHRSFEAPRTQHLPRILPLEAREASIPHRVPLLNDLSSSFGTNPRRSPGTNSPASFLRHDTSKSSTSSNVSGGSGGSATITPITPVDDLRPNRSLPLPPTLMSKPSLIGQSLTDLARPPVSSLTAKTDEFGIATPTQPGYAYSFHHLTITGNQTGDDRRSRSQSAHRDQHFEQAMHTRSISTHQPFHSVNRPDPLLPPPNINTQEHASRMDSLSVLALAGRMMDHQPHDRDHTEK